MRVPLEHGQGPAGDVVIFVYGAEVVSGYVEGTETLWHTTTTANKDQDLQIGVMAKHQENWYHHNAAQGMSTRLRLILI